ncbi:MAG: hypothetical protein UH249_08695 [Acutalibacteraceae bacterium]|nr:hypothetical protein [Acutalibacteraceae bacterium]
MGKYESSKATQIAQNEFFKYDFENIELPGKEYIDALNNASFFTEKLLDQIKKSGYDADSDDAGQLTSYVLSCCKSEGISISRQNIINWLSGGTPVSSSAGRDNVYKLCFALGMNEKQTGEFFLKAYLERPYNYKNIAESVYYFCLKNGLGYSKATEILQKIEEIPLSGNDSTIETTELVGRAVDAIRDERDLIKYLAENRASFSKQNKTATEKINQLLTECMELAEREYSITNPHEESISVTNVDELLNVIYGYSARATEGFEEKNGKSVPKAVYKESISESSFPELIRRNFPQRQQFENIGKNKASYDVIRKALVMLNFYHFFADATVNDADLESGLFDEFVIEINETLERCGYVQLYWRNPYDWMIGYCACSPSPLAELRDLIYEYYQGNDEIYQD